MKGTNWFSRNFKTMIYIAFLVPIITVAIVSISHVTGWYGMSNPMSWALYLSIGVEIAALSALAAISVNMGSKVYVPFGIVTIIQFVGNIFFAFEYIDIASTQFLSWVDLTGPMLEYVGVEMGNLQSHKRFLAIFSGGMLPLISLSFLHMLVKFNEERVISSQETIKEDIVSSTDIKEEPIQASDLVGEIARYRPTTDELDELEMLLSKIKSHQKGLVEEPIKDSEPPTVELDGVPEIDEEENEWANDPDVLDFLNRQDEQGPWSEEDDKIYTVGGLTNDKDREFTKFQQETEYTEEDLNDWDVTLNDGLEDLNDIEVNEPETVEPNEVDEDIIIPSKNPHVGFEQKKVNRQSEVQLPDSVENAELNLNTGQITTPIEQLKEINVVLDELPDNKGPEFNVDVQVGQVPQVTFKPSQPDPNFIYKEPINETKEDITNDDPEKKKQ